MKYSHRVKRGTEHPNTYITRCGIQTNGRIGLTVGTWLSRALPRCPRCETGEGRPQGGPGLHPVTILARRGAWHVRRVAASCNMDLGEAFRESIVEFVLLDGMMSGRRCVHGGKRVFIALPRAYRGKRFLVRIQPPTAPRGAPSPQATAKQESPAVATHPPAGGER